MTLRIAATVVTVSLALGSTASAQQQSLFGGGTGGTGGATGGAGQAGGGIDPGAAGAFEQGGPALTTELGGLSQNAGQAGFLGRNTEGGFLGANVDTAAGQGGQAATNFRPGGGGGGNANNGGGQTTSGARRVIRPRARIAFDFPAPPPAAVDLSVRANITKLATRRPEFGGVRIAVDPAGLAVLSGRVPDEGAAKLALAMVRLEPGVRRVESNLTVGGLVAPPRP